MLKSLFVVIFEGVFNVIFVGVIWIDCWLLIFGMWLLMQCILQKLGLMGVCSLMILEFLVLGISCIVEDLCWGFGVFDEMRVIKLKLLIFVC